MKEASRCKSVKFTFPSLKTREEHEEVRKQTSGEKREQRKPNKLEKAIVLDNFHF